MNLQHIGNSTSTGELKSTLIASLQAVFKLRALSGLTHRWRLR